MTENDFSRAAESLDSFNRTNSIEDVDLDNLISALRCCISFFMKKEFFLINNFVQRELEMLERIKDIRRERAQI